MVAVSPEGGAAFGVFMRSSSAMNVLLSRDSVPTPYPNYTSLEESLVCEFRKYSCMTSGQGYRGNPIAFGVFMRSSSAMDVLSRDSVPTPHPKGCTIQ